MRPRFTTRGDDLCQSPLAKLPVVMVFKVGPERTAWQGSALTLKPTLNRKGQCLAWKYFKDPRVQSGLTPEQYLTWFEQQANQPVADLDDEAAQMVEYTRLNLHRSQRIERTFQPSSRLAELLTRIKQPQLWLVITEPWCGDSAQCLPYITVMARTNPNITVRLVLRDENLDLMDEFLTNGKRAIPRLVAFDQAGQEVFQWGPRPAAAQAVFDLAKAEDMEKSDLLERLHLFYGRDRGKALEKEFVTLLESLNT